MSVLSKELQDSTQTSNELWFIYSILLKIKSIISTIFNNCIGKRFKKLLVCIYKNIKHFLSLSKWLLAPKYVLKIAVRHGILLFLLSIVPFFGSVLIAPLTKWIHKKYLIYTKGRNWLKRHNEINDYLRNKCKTYNDWRSSCSDLDQMEGKYEWIMTDTSKYYNYKKLYFDTTRLKKYLASCRYHDKRQNIYNNKNVSFVSSLSSSSSSSSLSSIQSIPLASNTYFYQHPISELMQFIRSTIIRHYCGITNKKLYVVSRTCTKQLICDFLEELCNCIKYISLENKTLNNKEKLVYLNELQTVLGRTVLCLSGGSSFGSYHNGVVLELWKQKLLPQIICGSSAGSMTAAYLCVFLESKYSQFALADEWSFERGLFRPNTGNTQKQIRTALKRFYHKGHLLKADVLANTLKKELGDITFKESYKKTGKILNITVTGNDENTVPRLLNYLTSPNVVIWSAIMASCAFPRLFEPQTLYLKQYIYDENEEVINYELIPALNLYENEQFLDGSLAQDIPIMRLQQLFNANNFIISNVNPFSVVAGVHQSKNDSQNIAFDVDIRNDTNLFTEYVKNEYKLFVGFLADLFYGIKNKLFSDKQIINLMNYNQFFNDNNRFVRENGVVIYPNIQYSDLFLELMHNNTRERYNNCVEIGAKATWKHISRLNTLCKVESCLEYCIKCVKYNIINKKVINEFKESKEFKNEGLLLCEGDTIPRTLSEILISPKGHKSPKIQSTSTNAPTLSRKLSTHSSVGNNIRIQSPISPNMNRNPPLMDDFDLNLPTSHFQF